jgi:glutamate/tyrosine decarboxylase-like PLP-dependent enzyme
LGDLIAAALNIDAGAWREASGPSQLELTVVDWFREWVGYPRGAAGILVSGGSASNLTAIATAREASGATMSTRSMIYVSDQAHSSIARAARHLGYRSDQLRVIPTDRDMRMRLDVLSAAIDEDLRLERLPFLVAAAAGTTNTGAVDDLQELQRICDERGLWLHVDAAYGGFSVLTERGRQATAGLEGADSITLDPHKWLAMPFEVGCLMVKRGDDLTRAFELHPEYLRERQGIAAGVDFADRGLQLTRSARAIKVWLAISTFGVAAFREAIDRALDLTLEAEARIAAEPRLEIVTRASLGIVTFRRRGFPGDRPADVDRRNAALVKRLAASGEVFLTGTLVHGRYAIRLCVLNHTSGPADVRMALDLVLADPLEDAGDGPTHVAARDRGVDLEWLRSHDLDVAHLRAFEPFASVSDDAGRRFLGAGQPRRVEPGEPVTDRWAFARSFFLVRSGRLAVRVGDRELAVLGPGDHLGEIAAIDWGRDFSYGRTATVVAVEPSELVEFPASALRDLLAESADVDRVLRRIADERLARS